MDRVAEGRQRLWIVPGPLVVWALHFMLSYLTAALWCGKAVGRLGSLLAARQAIGVFTVVALAVILGIAWLGYRAHTAGVEPSAPPHDADSPEDRHRFLGFCAGVETCVPAPDGACMAVWPTVIAVGPVVRSKVAITRPAPAVFHRAKSAGWGRAFRVVWTSGWSPRRTATWRRKSAMAASVRICSSA